MKTYQCEPVGVDFIDSAPFRFVSKVDLAIKPEQLFEVFSDETSWPRWATLITNVEWTSPKPYGVGTTRTVTMRGHIVGDEEFIGWEPFSYMAFRFNTSTSNMLSAFAEGYTVEETADGAVLHTTLTGCAYGPGAKACGGTGPDIPMERVDAAACGE